MIRICHVNFIEKLQNIVLRFMIVICVNLLLFENFQIAGRFFQRKLITFLEFYKFYKHFKNNIFLVTKSKKLKKCQFIKTEIPYAIYACI